MSEDALFDTGSSDRIPRKVLRPALCRGRTEFGKGEDDWLEDELSTLRLWLPPEYRQMSLHTLKKQCQRLRKDKLICKTQEPASVGARVFKAGRDFAKRRKKEGRSHSARYEQHINSDEWRATAELHRKWCGHRCQLCGRSKTLQVHHTPEGYCHLGQEEPWHLLALCQECHWVADLLREHGKELIENEASNCKLLNDFDAYEIFGLREFKTEAPPARTPADDGNGKRP